MFGNESYLQSKVSMSLCNVISGFSADGCQYSYCLDFLSIVLVIVCSSSFLSIFKANSAV